VKRQNDNGMNVRFRKHFQDGCIVFCCFIFKISVEKKYFIFDI